MKRLSYSDTLAMLEDLPSGGVSVGLAFESQTIHWADSEGEHALKIPRIYPRIDEGEDFASYLARIPDVPPPFWIVLIRAGTASMGCYIDGELEAHKVIRKYMVRKSQGRTQIAYLNQKGKSRAGSRVRLRESVEFFEEINEKLSDWKEDFGEPEWILQSCPVRLWSHWFESRVEAPYRADDPIWVHIPFHVHQPDHEELLRIHRLISTAILDP